VLGDGTRSFESNPIDRGARYQHCEASEKQSCREVYGSPFLPRICAAKTAATSSAVVVGVNVGKDMGVGELCGVLRIQKNA
jgi:hypothetical protein